MASHFKPPRFYPIIDKSVLERSVFTPLMVAEEAAASGAGILQYRHKDSWTQASFDEAKAISKICEQSGVLFILNDRADYAQLLRAGLHIGQEDLPPVAARVVIAHAILGFSTHNALQLRRAGEMPVDYLSLGPIFTTDSKERPDPVVGVDGLRALRVLTTKPLVAIGGIKLENAREVLAAGADSVAVISGLVPGGTSRGDLRKRMQDWLDLTKDV